MKELETLGLVIKEVRMGEADKLLTLMTPNHGKILVMGKGVSSLRSKHMAAANIFCYSHYVLRKSKKYFYISESDTEECFFHIRFDVIKVALAQYLCDIACDLSLENVEDPELMRLMLNTLYALGEKKQLALEQIKASFEFRAAVQAGFLPILDVCGVCGCELTDDRLVFDILEGTIKCDRCSRVIKDDEAEGYRAADSIFNINRTVLEALRYIAYAPLNKYMLFKIPPEDLNILSAFAEKYLISHLEHSFSSLKYYKNIKQYGIDYEQEIT